jgi:hypothetical protein
MSCNNEEGQAQPGRVYFDLPAPDLEGVHCQVQRGGFGNAVDDKGTLGVGAILWPDGKSRMIVQIRHADGSNLAAILDEDEFLAIVDCIVSAGEKAESIERAAVVSGGSKQ